ncbi:hypothetical protein MIR68_001832 [Amoeboaphelidium protococcarum]|nr:hypothetical protein MIR68_001832 [Amoeboaphelidium protococcarum]
MDNYEITDLLNYLQSLQPVPQSLITDLQQNQDDAYWRLFRLSRKQWQQKDSVHGNDIFYHFVYSHAKPLEYINEVIGLCFQECRWNQMRSGTATSRSVSTKYPQITKIDLRAWKNFDEIVSSFVAQLPDQQLLEFMSLPRQRNVSNESDVQAMLNNTILQMVSLTCQSLSANEDYSYFRGNCNFVSIHGAYVLGDPDQVWVSDIDKGLPKLTIELKTPWAVRSMVDLVTIYEQEYVDYYRKVSERKEPSKQIEKGKTIRAVEQIYAYMTLNRHRYGVLTTLNETVFLRKVEDSEQEGCSVLEVSPAVRCSQRNPYTLVAAWLWVLAQIEGHPSQLMYASPHSSNVVSPVISRRARPISYTSVELDKFCHWKDIIARGKTGAVALGDYANQQKVTFKTVDLTKNPEAKDLFDHEVRMYQELESLQGSVIPKFYAYGTLCGFLQMIVIENVGQSMTIEQCKERQGDIDAALKQIHDLGYQHGDVRPANLTIDNQGRVRIIDLERTKKVDGDICEVYDSDLVD